MTAHRPPTRFYNGDIPSQHRHIYPRDDPPFGSQTTFIIVIVLACIGGILFVLILWRLIARGRSRKRSAPLPPAQPLAHHREQHLQAFEALTERSHSRPATWYDGEQRMLLKNGSDVSLGVSPSRYPSSRTYGSEYSDASPVQFSDELDTMALPPPNPPFQRDATPSPLGTSASTSSLGSYDPEPKPFPISSSAAPSTTSLAREGSDDTPAPDGLPRSRSLPASRPHPRPRPLSMASVSTTFTTRTRVSTIRGAPHRPHSRVDIILPTPLAPSVYPYMVGHRGSDAHLGISREERALKTRSVSDTWVPTGLVTGSQEDLAKYDKRTTSGTLGSLPRPPSYHSRPSRSESPLSSSFSASSNAHRDRSPHSTNPPVPPLPSAYNLRRQSLPPSSASDTDYHHYPPSENHSDTSRPPTRSTDTHEGRPLPHTPRKHTPPSKEYLRGDDGITKGSIQQEVHEVVNSAES